MQWLVGNDIVDLTLEENQGQANNKRLIERVLTPKEAAIMAAAENPDLVYWTFWSAKEAVYKVLKKLDDNLVFCHSRFKIHAKRLETLNYSLSFFKGEVQFDDYSIPVFWAVDKDWVHCIAYHCEKSFLPKVLDWNVRPLKECIGDEHFVPEEELSIYGVESRAARILAKKMLKDHQIEDPQIIRYPVPGKRFSPPRICRNQLELADWDLSLSHDGQFVAAAISR
jgi:phosphopantetheinyl transferase (holo-ACP synthase)